MKTLKKKKEGHSLNIVLPGTILRDKTSNSVCNIYDIKIQGTYGRLTSNSVSSEINQSIKPIVLW